jgi:two-component system, NarL family, nitrate/nitrite response regulator NarL
MSAAEIVNTDQPGGARGRGPESGQSAAGSRPIRLLIADQPATCLGIRMVLGTDVFVCAEESEADQAIRAAKQEQPDVALVAAEISAERYAVVRAICRAAPGCAVVVLAQAGDTDDMLAAVRAGAVGYVPGALDGERLQRVFRAVTHNEAVVPRAMVGELLSELRDHAAVGDLVSSREAQVLGMLRRRHSTGEIAERLQISPVTVRRHISELVLKLGVESRSDLIDQGPV